MISLDSLTSATNGSTGAYGGQSESQSNSWLLELERAWLNSGRGGESASQPGADSRTESSSANADEGYSEKKSAVQHEGSPAEATGSLSMRPAFTGVAAPVSSLQFDSRMPAAFASLRQALEISMPVNQLPVNGRAAGMKPTETARLGAQEQFSSLAAAEDRSSESPQAPAESEAAYPEKRLHLLEDEHGVRVWIRDAALSEERGYAVANALRAELGAAGLRLAAVALNGKEIAGSGESSPASGTASLEQDCGYVRSMIDESNLFIGKLSQKEHS